MYSVLNFLCWNSIDNMFWLYIFNCELWLWLVLQLKQFSLGDEFIVVLFAKQIKCDITHYYSAARRWM
jgi:hypothetical protein